MLASELPNTAGQIFSGLCKRQKETGDEVGAGDLKKISMFHSFQASCFPTPVHFTWAF